MSSQIGAPPRRAVFLDRDGTVIKDAGYLSEPDAVSLVPGAAEVLRAPFVSRASCSRSSATNRELGED